MKLSYLPVLLLLMMIGGQACVSKRMAKQAIKLEEAGLYEMAAESYLRSFNANRNNIDAATGLGRTGQRTLEARTDLVNQAWLAGNDRETVYRYLDAQAYQQRIRSAGIELSMTAQAHSHYEDARPRFLDRSFDEARLLLDEENFSQAESILAEIKSIDPSYQNLSHYMRISRSEPLYREGVDQFRSGFYRRAYQTFSQLIDTQGAYKDAKEMREDALSKGRITIAIADFENISKQRNAHNTIKTRITAELSKPDNPFIQVVDDRNMNAFLMEQKMASGVGSDMRIGQLLAAKALLTGRLISIELREGPLQKTEKRAYLKEVIEITDNVTREKSTRTLYHKVTYLEFRKENSAWGSFEFQLSSSETGAVLTSGVINLNPVDQLHYAVFEGKSENLVPGHWEYADKDSPRDNIQDKPGPVKELQGLFPARQTIRSTGALRDELTDGIALAVSRAVNSYNPEQ